jgi:Uma2 family endonuclease
MDQQPALAALTSLADLVTPREMERKVREYFDAGTTLVWIINPRTRSAEAFSSPGEWTRIEEDGVLEGGAILPGFEVRLRDLFARASRDGRA